MWFTVLVLHISVEILLLFRMEPSLVPKRPLQILHDYVGFHDNRCRSVTVRFLLQVKDAIPMAIVSLRIMEWCLNHETCCRWWYIFPENNLVPFQQRCRPRGMPWSSWNRITELWYFTKATKKIWTLLLFCEIANHLGSVLPRIRSDSCQVDCFLFKYLSDLN